MGIKIDTSTIEGFAEMTPEEQVNALLAVEMPDLTGEVERYKAAQSKASSEAAELKRKLRERMSDDEKAKQERDDATAQLQQELETLKREKAEAGFRAQFLELGYAPDLATSAATAMATGDVTSLFEHQRTFLEAHDKAVEANLMRNTPAPIGGSGSNTPNYASLIADAQKRGDFTTAAAYTRMMQENPN